MRTHLKTLHRISFAKGSRNFFFRGLATNVKEWLLEKGFDETISDGIIKAFPGQNASLTDLKGLGEEGLKDLADAVKRQEKQKTETREMININVNVPMEMYNFDMQVPVGGTFQTVAEENDQIKQYLECACGGDAACSTCHVIVDPEFFEKIPRIAEEEQDMLDLAAELSETSRLGCQIHFTKELEGLKVSIPTEFNNVLGTSGGTSV